MPAFRHSSHPSGVRAGTGSLALDMRTYHDAPRKVDRLSSIPLSVRVPGFRNSGDRVVVLHLVFRASGRTRNPQDVIVPVIDHQSGHSIDTLGASKMAGINVFRDNLFSGKGGPDHGRCDRHRPRDRRGPGPAWGRRGDRQPQAREPDRGGRADRRSHRAAAAFRWSPTSASPKRSSRP